MNESRMIRLVEYKTINGVILTHHEATILHNEFAHALTIRSEGQDEYQLTAASYVGKIVLGNLSIEIHPKLPIPLLWDWLAYAYDIRSLKWTQQAGYEEDFGDLEWLIKAYIRECRRIVAHGLRKAYVTEQAVIESARGSLNATTTASLWLKQEYRFDCRYDEFTSWAIENQCIFAGLTDMMRFSIQDKKLLIDIQNLLQLFGAHKPAALHSLEVVRLAKPELDHMKPNRLNIVYMPAFQLLRMFWRQASLSFESGGIRVQSFLLDMNELYERYIFRRLEDELKGDGIHVVDQQHDWLAEGGKIRILPDILLRCKEQEVILDTKYKRKTDESSINQDVFQMLAYMTARKSQHAILLYASGPEREDQVKHTGMMVYQWSLELEQINSDREQFEARIRVIVDRVRGLFGGI